MTEPRIKTRVKQVLAIATLAEELQEELNKAGVPPVDHPYRNVYLAAECLTAVIQMLVDQKVLPHERDHHVD